MGSAYKYLQFTNRSLALASRTLHRWAANATGMAAAIHLPQIFICLARPRASSATIYPAMPNSPHPKVLQICSWWHKKKGLRATSVCPLYSEVNEAELLRGYAFLRDHYLELLRGPFVSLAVNPIKTTERATHYCFSLTERASRHVRGFLVARQQHDYASRNRR